MASRDAFNLNFKIGEAIMTEPKPKFGINPKYRKEFELDAELKNYEKQGNQSAILDTLWQMFQNRLELDGWRRTVGRLIDSEKSKSYDGSHISPPAELDFRAGELAVKEDIGYSEAVQKILEADPFLNAAYTMFDPQQHFKEWLSTSPVGKDLLDLA
jgi:hypothetical protein